MANLLLLLERNSQTALKKVKNTNPVLKEIFLSIPEAERAGLDVSERGSVLKRWLVDWATAKQRRYLQEDEDEQAPPHSNSPGGNHGNSHGNSHGAGSPHLHGGNGAVQQGGGGGGGALVDAPLLSSPMIQGGGGHQHHMKPESPLIMRPHGGGGGGGAMISTPMTSSPPHMEENGHTRAWERPEERELDFMSPLGGTPPGKQETIVDTPLFTSPLGSTQKRKSVRPRPPQAQQAHPEGTPRTQFLLHQQLAAQQQEQELLREQIAQQQKQQQQLLDRQRDMEEKMMMRLRNSPGSPDGDIGLRRRVDKLTDDCRRKDATIAKLTKLVETLMESIEDSVLEAKGELTFALA